MKTSDKKKIIDSMDHLQIYRNIIKQDVVLGRGIKSPFRNDKKPSFGIYRSKNGSIRWKDFAHSGGDVYSLVMTMENCSFKDAIDKLYKDLGNNININIIPDEIERPKEYEYGVIYSYTGHEKDEVYYLFDQITSLFHSVSLMPIFQHSNKYEFEKNSLITKLEKEFGIKEFSIAAYDGYYFGAGRIIKREIKEPDNNGIIRFGSIESVLNTDDGILFIKSGKSFKCWYPKNQKEFRYKSGPSDGSFFGELLMNKINKMAVQDVKIKDILIMAGEKDVVSFASNNISSEHLIVITNVCADNNYIDTFPVCLSSESANLTWDQYNKMKSSCNGNIFILYDNDETGKKNMKKICQEYPDIIPLNMVHNMYPELNDYNDIVVANGVKDPINWKELKEKAIKQNEELGCT